MGFEKQAVQGASVRRIAEAMQGCEQRRNAPLIEVQRKGGLAQLGEHLLCKQGVVGSIPSSSTNCPIGGGVVRHEA